MKAFLSIFLLFTSVLGVLSVDLNDVEEGDCISPPADKSFDFNWAVTGSPEWYYVIWGKYDQYRTISSLMDTPESRLTEDQAERSCPSVKWLGNTAGVVTGFAGTRKMPIDIKSTEDGTWEFTHKPNNTPGKRGKTIVSLTDNKSYYVTIQCWGEVKKGYAVISTEKTLDEDTKTTIFDHLTELGFESKNRVEMSYDDCITLPSLETTTSTFSPFPPSGGDSSTGNSNPSGPLSGILSIFRRKVDFLRRLIMSIIRFLSAPVRFLTSSFANLRLGRGGADRG